MKTTTLSTYWTVWAFRLTALLLISSCQTKNAQTDISEKEKDYILSADTVILTENSSIRSNLTFHTVQEQPHSMEFSTTGVVKTIPTAYAEIAAPFAGRILRSFVQLGQHVQIGTPLFEISSPDYYNAQKEYFDAKQEFRQSELNLKRQQDLVKNAVGTQRDLEIAETEYSLRKTAFSNAGAALKIFQVNPEQLTLGQPLIVRSPIQGKLLSNRIIMGQYLKEDAEPIATIAELSKVWIAAQVKEKDIHFIQKLDEVQIKSAAFPERLFKGQIFHINEIIQEETRSVEVLVACDNTDLTLKPGMYVTLYFKNKVEQALLIPTEAIFQHEDKQFVYVKIDDSHFEKRNILTAGVNADYTIVTAGLQKGENIVAQGGFLLNKSY